MSVRLVAERGARALAVIALVAAFWLTGRPSASTVTTREAIVNSADPERLAEWVSDPAHSTVHADLRAIPGAPTRALLHAARQAGLLVSWSAHDSSTALTPLALSVSPLPDPNGGVTVRVSAPTGSTLALGDSLGWLDSAVVTNGGVGWPLVSSARELTVTSSTSVARASPVALAPLRRLRLFAVPGWEARFAMRALEEAGWRVDASFGIAPRVAVTAGAPAPIDTARYAAVIALDSSAWSSAARIAAFVRSGGGLVLFPAAASGSAFAGVRSGTVGMARAGIPGALALASPREGLLMRPIVSLRGDAVVLERSFRPGNPVVMAARRVGSGRVLQVGWENSWEWRMLGGDRAETAHRDWWRGLLHRTARSSAERAIAPMSLPGDAAPYADLVARLGPPSEAMSRTGASDRTPAPPPAWLFAIAALALLAEWWSRRLRGAR